MPRITNACLTPPWDQIEKTAYERWERRGGSHGSDREDWLAAERELTYGLNYRPVARYDLGSPTPIYLGPLRPARCRFCEQASPIAAFSSSRSPIPETLGKSSIISRDVCDECAQSFADNLEAGFSRFWRSLPDLISGDSANSTIPLVAFKALTWMALALMPEADLEYFTDALEWVGNPDHDEDSSVFSRLACLGYSVPAPSPSAWVSLERRSDEDALIPSLLFFLASGGFILQLPVPLGVLDQESDGEEMPLLRRSWTQADVSGPEVCRLLTPAPALVSAGRRSPSGADR
jgi:hypothetical protein